MRPGSKPPLPAADPATPRRLSGLVAFSFAYVSINARVNPIDTESDIRALEIMLYGGSPLRPAADFGRQDMGHFDPARVRAPEVYPASAPRRESAQLIVESYVLSDDGTMHVRTAGQASARE